MQERLDFLGAIVVHLIFISSIINICASNDFRVKARALDWRPQISDPVIRKSVS